MWHCCTQQDGGDGDNISQSGDTAVFPDRVTEADPEHHEEEPNAAGKMADTVSTPDSVEGME